MAFCGKCGAYIAEGSNVCPACGKRVGGPEEEKRTAQANGGAQAQSEQPGRERPGERKETPRGDKTGEYHYKYSKADTDTRKDSNVEAGSGIVKGPFPMISALAYFSCLFFIPYFLRKDSEFARFHANQGLVLFLSWVAIQLVSKITAMGWIASVVGKIFLIICTISGVCNVLEKRIKPLPIIGGIRLLK